MEGYKYVTGVGLGVPAIWLVVFLVVYALATFYVAIKYREVRKVLAGAFFVSSGTCWYLWVTGVSLPITLPYVGTVSVESPEISGQRAMVHFVLFLLCFYFGFISNRCSRNEILAIERQANFNGEFRIAGIVCTGIIRHAWQTFRRSCKPADPTSQT